MKPAVPPPAPWLADGLAWLFDSHCHVVADSYGGDPGVDAVLARARQAGVGRFLVIGSGYGEQGPGPALEVAARHGDVWASAGMHPHDARLWSAEREAELRRALASARCVAVGETGLDFFYDQSPRPAQRAAFRGQIRLALELDLPLIVHDRDSEGEVLAILLEEGAFQGAGVLWHCFTGDLALMQGVVAAGGHLSLSGIVTFASAEALRAVARAVPIERLLIETDSPWLAPVPHRGRQNEPMFVGEVARRIAQERNGSAAELARQSFENASRLFRLPAR